MRQCTDIMILEGNMNDEKLAQFYYMCKTENADINTWVLQKELAVNSSVNCNFIFSGYTPLHIAVYTANLCAVKILLKNGADCTLKNAEGQTPVHLCMRMILFDHDYTNNLQFILDELLSFHATNFLNPIDNDGLSHFHIACFAKKVNVIKNFLNHGFEINSIINFNSPFWAGYTPLHIATNLLLKEVIDLLVQYGANIRAKNAEGLNPLHIAIQKLNIPIIKLLFSSLNSTDREGLSILHLMCIFNDPLDHSEIYLEPVENVNISIEFNWPFWAGYTPLHVAVYYKNMFMIRKLVSLGADFNAKDANGLSSLQLAMNNNIITEALLTFLLSEYKKRDTIKSICDLNLYNFFTACMSCDKKSIQNFLNCNVDVNSSIPSDYPFNLTGYTPLHLAVECGSIEIIELLIKNNADLCLQNAENLSPVHLAYKRGKYHIAKKILSFHQQKMKNSINNDGLSHLHMACMFNLTSVITKFLQDEVDVNLVTNVIETSLHFAVRFKAKESVQLLLKHNADFTIQEKNSNSTPLHVAFQIENNEIINMFLSVHEKVLVNPVNKVGLSHFHIICKYNKVNIAEKFLLNKLVKNDVIALNSKSYAGFTPLHFAAKFKSIQTANVLLHHGANFYAKDANKKTPLHYFFSPELNDISITNNPKIRENENILCKINLVRIPKLLWIKINENSTKLLDDMGLNALHIACIMNDINTVKNLLESGLDINSCISMQCSEWPGFSPLHFAVKYESVETVKFLLKYKANINIQDKYGFTPLHLALKFQNNEIIRIILSETTDRLSNIKDKEGLSAFHIACMKNMINTVSGFLENGVNVDEIINPFSLKFAGFTPLHIAVKFEHVEILKLLLKYGANTNAVTSEGDSALHLCYYSINEDKKYVMIHELLQFGANPNAKDINGNTVTELAVKKHEKNIVELVLKYGVSSNLNFCRSLELAVIERQIDIVNLLLDNGTIATIEAEDGNTFIHKLTLNHRVNENCLLEILVILLERGCNLDAVDSSGRTPLHCSYWPLNLPKLRVLLSCGADINVEDRSGRTIVSYYFEIRTSRMPLTSIYQVLRRHLEVRKITGFALSRNNETLYKSLLEEEHDAVDDDVQVACEEEMERMKKLRFGYYSMYQLFRDAKKMAAHLARNGALARFLKSSEFREQFPLCDCVVMMQYRVALSRKDLLLPATMALDRIITFIFPELSWNTHCSEVIVMYLDNEDLRNLQNTF